MATDESGPNTPDKHTSRLLDEEMAAAVRVFFALACPRQEPAVEHRPALPTPPPDQPQVVQHPSAIELPAMDEPDHTVLVPPPSAAAPAAIPLPPVTLALEPINDQTTPAELQPSGQRQDSASLDLLEEIAFLDG